VNVSYTAPLRRAWERARALLLRPFRLATWMTLGFAAFLSELLSSHQGGFGWRGLRRPLGHEYGWPHEWSFSPLVLGIAAIVVTCVIGVFVALLWVSSRGKFIFLDDVAHARAEIVAPWKRFARLGNSLFAWALVFGLACLAILALLALPFVAAIAALFQGGEFRWAGLGALLGFFLMAVPVGIALAYAGLFLSDFVVPIMYRDDLGASAAWRKFLVLLRAHPGSFLMYGLWVFALWTVTLSACLAVGFVTCCVGFVVLGLPYIGTVALLPVYVTARGLGPEFLAQFGADYATLPAVQAPPPPAPATQAPVAPAPQAPPQPAPAP
jgi:hypothetical protein